MAKTTQQRLDDQAAAIRDLRKRVADLEAARIGQSDTAVAETGVFVPHTDCMMCGKAKTPARHKYLTCKPCGTERQALVRSKSLPIVGACGNCRIGKSTTSLLCVACSKAYKVWQASL